MLMQHPRHKPVDAPRGRYPLQSRQEQMSNSCNGVSRKRFNTLACLADKHSALPATVLDTLQSLKQSAHTQEGARCPAVLRARPFTQQLKHRCQSDPPGPQSHSGLAVVVRSWLQRLLDEPRRTELPGKVRPYLL